MQLTSENYYSQEANQEYMSVSGYKDFAGTYGKMPCEFYGMEKLNGRWQDEKSTALLVGSYVDSYFEGSLDQFKKDNPEIFTQKGELKANFKQAEEIIARIERDEYFMKYMSGQKQVIMTGELFGAKWKIKMDSYIPGFEGHGIHYGFEVGKRHRLPRFCPLLGLRHPGCGLPGNRETEYRREAAVLHCRSN